MLKKLKPNQAVQSIYHIKLRDLRDRGVFNIIIDLDNTITPWGEDLILPEVYHWINTARGMGFNLCILSNSSGKRVRHVASKLGVLAAPKRGKPLSRAFKSAMLKLNANQHDTVVIGDQIFTDIFGGNRMNLYTILVEPISKREFIGTRVARLLEKIIVGRRKS
jgi:hypothetical protein